MAFIDDDMEDSKGNNVNIIVPSMQGGTDRNIYKNDNFTGYRLGDWNNEIYTESGRHVSELPLKDFVKQFLWILELASASSFLFIK